LNLHPAPLLTDADAGMLDQVLMNLAVNARDAMPNGGRLTLETFDTLLNDEQSRLNAGAAPGRFVCLKVIDTGSGIATENLPQIFEPFFTTKEPGKGTGLGLATVFGIVKQHHGWLRVQSEPGCGATFEIFLPESTSTAAVIDPVADKAPPAHGCETILLVEDDEAVRALMRVVLERQSYRVLEAGDGVEAMKIWEQSSAEVALLLTDMIMPEGMTGQELATRLQAQKPELKVIVCSGYSLELAGRELKLPSGQHFLEKPARPEQLLHAIRTTLDG
jgi:CheY-like chemotaxis protein